MPADNGKFQPRLTVRPSEAERQLFSNYLNDMIEHGGSLLRALELTFGGVSAGLMDLGIDSKDLLYWVQDVERSREIL